MAVAALHPTRALLSLMAATTASVWLLAIGYGLSQSPLCDPVRLPEDRLDDSKERGVRDQSMPAAPLYSAMFSREGGRCP